MKNIDKRLTNQNKKYIRYYLNIIANRLSNLDKSLKIVDFNLNTKLMIVNVNSNYKYTDDSKAKLVRLLNSNRKQDEVTKKGIIESFANSQFRDIQEHFKQYQATISALDSEIYSELNSIVTNVLEDVNYKLNIDIKYYINSNSEHYSITFESDRLYSINNITFPIFNLTQEMIDSLDYPNPELPDLIYDFVLKQIDEVTKAILRNEDEINDMLKVYRKINNYQHIKDFELMKVYDKNGVLNYKFWSKYYQIESKPFLFFSSDPKFVKTL